MDIFATVGSAGHKDFWLAVATILPILLLAGTLITVPARSYFGAKNSELDKKKNAGERTGFERFFLTMGMWAYYFLTITIISVMMILSVAAEVVALVSLGADWDGPGARIFVLIVVSLLTALVAIGVVAQAMTDLERK